MSTILYNSCDTRCKLPFGAARTDEVVMFRVFLPISYQLESPVLLMYKADRWDTPERIPMEFEQSDGVCISYRCIFYAPDPQLYFYLFEVEGVNGPTRIVRGAEGFGQLAAESQEMWQLTVYDKAMRTPEFMKRGVMYQIFPDRFCNSGLEKSDVPADRRMHTNWYEMPEYLPDQNGKITNSDYFGGDLQGIVKKLPYLKSLGVSVLYLNPIFEAHSNHRYNTANYEKVDPLLGTEEDLRELCRQAKELGMHLILDGVFNHTGSDSIYFNKQGRYGASGAYHDPESPYRSWYDFINYPTEYQSWWGFRELPNLNEKDPSYVAFVCGEKGVLRKWLEAGVSGYRLDVADELPDEFLDQISDCVKGYNSQAAVIGEVWEDATTKIAYGVRRRYFLGGQLDSVMNYPFKDAILAYVREGDAPRLYNTIMTILEHYPQPVLDVLMNSLSTHDIERAITTLGGQPVGQNGREWQGQNNSLSPRRYEQGKRLFKLASVLQYMLPGIPCLYYGDEAGLYGYKDPFNRSCYPWGREDTELLAHFRALGKIRAEYPGLSTGMFSAVAFTGEMVSFLRDCEANTFFVAINRTDHDLDIMVPPEFSDAEALYGELCTGNILRPYSCVILTD